MVNKGRSEMSNWDNGAVAGEKIATGYNLGLWWICGEGGRFQ